MNDSKKAVSENAPAPVAIAEMLIRKPVSEVFEAFINPKITTKIWFTKSTGKLEEGKTVCWTWEMYDFSTEVNVKQIQQNKRILVEWGAYENATEIEWTFKPTGEDSTFVSIKNSGFQGTAEKRVNLALESTEGFTIVLAGLKALLEHGIQLNLVAD